MQERRCQAGGCVGRKKWDGLLCISICVSRIGGPNSPMPRALAGPSCSACPSAEEVASELARLGDGSHASLHHALLTGTESPSHDALLRTLLMLSHKLREVSPTLPPPLPHPTPPNPTLHHPAPPYPTLPHPTERGVATEHRVGAECIAESSAPIRSSAPSSSHAPNTHAPNSHAKHACVWTRRSHTGAHPRSAGDSARDSARD